jgi:hypothetical protein
MNRPTGYVPPHRAATKLTERRRRILAQLTESPGGLAVRDIPAALRSSEATPAIREDLATLKGWLARNTGWGRGARWEVSRQ